MMDCASTAWAAWSADFSNPFRNSAAHRPADAAVLKGAPAIERAAQGSYRLISVM